MGTSDRRHRQSELKAVGDPCSVSLILFLVTHIDQIRAWSPGRIVTLFKMGRLALR